ncbi:MAG: trypsin-like serine protease [Bacteriovoracales bacterium]|nr:trypsin-like serine protease [Bacteriovoracales bacterium]
MKQKTLKIGMLALLFHFFPLQGHTHLKKNSIKERDDLSSRIVGFYLRPPGVPYSQFNLCTGTFLDGQTILTAAHCWRSSSPPTKEELKDHLLHVSGRDRISKIDLQKSFITKRFSLHIHPEYNRVLKLNDLMIIKLEDMRFKFTDPPPLLSIKNSLNWAEPYFFEGFGFIRRIQGNILQIKRPLIIRLDREKMETLKDIFKTQKGIYASRAKLYFNHSIEKPRDKSTLICYGDSGGPVYSRHSDGTLEILAVASAFTVGEEKKGKKKKYNRSCSNQNGSVHYWVYPHLDWITSFLN